MPVLLPVPLSAAQHANRQSITVLSGLSPPIPPPCAPCASKRLSHGPHPRTTLHPSPFPPTLQPRGSPCHCAATSQEPPSDRHLHTPTPPAPQGSIPTVQNLSPSPNTTTATAAGPRSDPDLRGLSLYGSRTAIGLQLLKLLTTAPADLTDASPPASATALPAATSLNPQAPSELSAAAVLLGEGRNEGDGDGGPVPCRTGASVDGVEQIAALAGDVTQLMTRHSDMSGLLRALKRCEETVNAARAGDGVVAGGRRGFGGFGGFGRSGGSSGFGGFGGSRLRSTLGAASHQSTSQASGTAASTTRDQVQEQQPSQSQQQLQQQSQQPQPQGQQKSVEVAGISAAAEKDVAAEGEVAGATGGRITRPPWRWSAVRRLVVLGGGSLVAYQSVLRSDRQSERETSRAVARLYQLALSRVLTTSAVLPGLGGTGEAECSCDDTQNTTLGAAAGMPAAAAGSTAASAPSTSPSSPPPPYVLYFDPEYMTGDLQIIEHLGRAPATPTTPQHDVMTMMAAAAATVKATDTAVLHPAVAATASPAPSTALLAHVPTLFYAPCCPREVYDTLLRTNLAAGTLPNVALIGNSLRGLTDSVGLLQLLAAEPGGLEVAGTRVGFGSCTDGAGRGLSELAVQAAGTGAAGGVGAGVGGAAEELFVQMVRSGRVAEELISDFGAHGVAVAVHLFVE